VRIVGALAQTYFPFFRSVFVVDLGGMIVINPGGYMKKLTVLGSLLMVFSLPLFAQETLTITTYYPAPFGVYKEMRIHDRLAIGDANNDGTIDNDDLAIYPAGHPNQGTPILGSLTVANSISIGTATPWANLDVAGGVKVGEAGTCGDNAAGCSANTAGTMRYCSGQIEYCDGINWRSAFGGACPTGFVDTGSGFCIQADEHSPRLWHDAVEYCASLEARLCCLSEWYIAYRNRGALGLNDMIGNEEWLNQLGRNGETTAFVAGRTECKYINNKIKVWKSSKPGDSGDLTNETKHFRCCCDK
jgi:hypothetical protein